MMDVLKPLRGHAPDARSNSHDDLLKRFLTPGEVVHRPEARTEPRPEVRAESRPEARPVPPAPAVNANDAARAAAMKFVRQMRIHQR